MELIINECTFKSDTYPEHSVEIRNWENFRIYYAPSSSSENPASYSISDKTLDRICQMIFLFSQISKEIGLAEGTELKQLSLSIPNTTLCVVLDFISRTVDIGTYNSINQETGSKQLEPIRVKNIPFGFFNDLNKVVDNNKLK